MRSRAFDLVSMPRFIRRTGGPAVIAALTLVVLQYWWCCSTGARRTVGFEVVGGHASLLAPG